MPNDRDLGCLPPGTRIILPTEQPIVLAGTRFLINRQMLNLAIAAEDRALELEKRLDTALKSQKSDSKVISALKWSAIGGSIVGAFVLGVMVR